jgi:prepilin peptidase CpaA
MQNISIQFPVMLVLIYCSITDIKSFKIKNESVILLLCLFAIAALMGAFSPNVVAHIAFGAAMFAVLLGSYALGLIGGGDAKLLSAAFLWIGPEKASVFCIFLGCAALIYFVLHKFLRILPGKPGPNGRTLIPYGPCIAAAWMAVLAIQHLN